MKLGKLAPKYHPKTLLLSKYVLADAPPPPPAKVFWEYKFDPSKIGMQANDRIGNCTCAAVAHYITLATAHTGKPVVPEVGDVIEMYSNITGYNPITGANDNGAAITDVLNYWQTKGLAGHKILAWAKLDYTNPLSLKRGIYIFGANDVGVQLPESAQEQFGRGENWEVIPNSPIEGGHCVLQSGFGAEGSNYQTWGKGDQKASNEWSALYLDEAYCVITSEWLNNATGLAPNQLNMDALVADLKELGVQ